MSDENNGGVGNWGEYRRLVLAELKRIDAQLELIKQRQAQIREDITTLKVKAGMWGAVAGTLPVASMLLWKLFN